MEKKTMEDPRSFFFITKSHTRGYSYCKLSFSYFTKKRKDNNQTRRNTPKPQNAQKHNKYLSTRNRSRLLHETCLCL